MTGDHLKILRSTYAAQITATLLQDHLPDTVSLVNHLRLGLEAADMIIGVVHGGVPLPKIIDDPEYGDEVDAFARELAHKLRMMFGMSSSFSQYGGGDDPEHAAAVVTVHPATISGGTPD